MTLTFADVDFGWIQCTYIYIHTYHIYGKLKLFLCLSIYLSFSFCSQLYDVRDIDDKMLRIIRIVISKPVVAGGTFNATLCKGLSELLDRDELPFIPEGYRYWPDGSMYLYLLGRKAKSFYTRPTTTTIRP